LIAFPVSFVLANVLFAAAIGSVVGLLACIVTKKAIEPEI
jgi:hypothetical protein